MQVTLRKACPEDFDYCASLYFAGMEKIIRDLNLTMSAQVANFRKRWETTQVRIITLDESAVGWLQTMQADGALFLAQLFVDAAFQRRAIGSEVIGHVVQEAAAADQPVTPGAVKTNPARRLYERLGFRITHQDERKFYMRRDPQFQTCKHRDE